MNFYSRRTRYEEHKAITGKRNKFKDCRDFYKLQIEKDIEEKGHFYTNHYLELSWYEANRPYFNLWPSIISMAYSLKIDVPWSSIPLKESKLLTSGLLLRFPDHKDVPHSLRTSLFSIVNMEKLNISEVGIGFLCFSDLGQKETIKGVKTSVHEVSTYPIYDNESSTVEDTLRDRINSGHYHPSNDFIVRVLICVSILSFDPDFVTPDLLSKDRDTAEKAGITSEDLDKLIARAHRRGKVGWDIGKNIECNPHFRRPHFALRWTEKGHSVPKIVPVKGTIVKRQEITKIPTGYLGKDDQ